MTDQRYKALTNLFNEATEDFWALPQATIDAFFDRLYAK